MRTSVNLLLGSNVRSVSDYSLSYRYLSKLGAKCDEKDLIILI